MKDVFALIRRSKSIIIIMSHRSGRWYSMIYHHSINTVLLVDDKEMITTGNNLSILHYHCHIIITIIIIIVIIITIIIIIMDINDIRFLYFNHNHHCHDHMSHHYHHRYDHQYFIIYMQRMFSPWKYHDADYSRY